MVGLLLALQVVGSSATAGVEPGPKPGVVRLVVDGTGPSAGASCAEPDPPCSGSVLAHRPRPQRFEPVRIAGEESPVFAPAAPSMDGGADQLFEYSDGFYARLALHRIASYGTLPLFAAQYFAGEELLRNVDHAAGWARAIHGPAAAGVAGLFLVNTVTGGMNMIEGIRDPSDRGRRTVHGLLMLIADAGFVWTGVTASGAGRYEPDSNELRTLHRKVALGSMGVATLGYLIMIPPFRK